MSNLLLLADIASISCSKNEIGVQTVDDETSSALVPQHSPTPSTSSNAYYEVAPVGHDYIKQADFDILVNANHDYYNRITQTDEDLEHSYAFSVSVAAADADCSAPFANYNVDDAFFEEIANLDEYMGLNATRNDDDRLSVFEEVVQDFAANVGEEVSRCGFESALFSDVVDNINVDALHFDDILRYVDKEFVETAKKNVEDPPITSSEYLHLCMWENCETSFANLNCLVAHLRKDHVNLSSSKNERFVCKWRNCRRGESDFKRRYLLERHLRIHTNEKPFQCSKCTNVFSTNNRLQCHARKHTLDDRPYVCEICGKRFAASGDYCRHLNVHNAKAKYNCVDCGKKYKDDSGLRKHKKKCTRQIVVQKEKAMKPEKILKRKQKTNKTVALDAGAVDLQNISLPDWLKQCFTRKPSTIIVLKL